MTTIAKTIRERRSIKSGYTSDPVKEETVLSLLEDAVYAPNHGLREPWRFIFVPGEKKEEFVAKLVATFPKEKQENRRNYFSQPAAFLIVVMKQDPRQKQWDENFGAVSSLIQNFQLLAWEQKLGVVWKTNPHIYEPKVHDILGIEKDEKVAGFLHLGYFREEDIPVAKTRTSAKEKLTVYS
ncbi:nitroreductase [Bacillus sp. H-16]|uniref:nitroreductase family protein n=1 Tax=Alteribacter salitolerans TaxID=2912333 RepID=UPI0019642605|nr:nitroreductase [Alteribacter salitolerans]MBM7096135.1 nitroreductase [Alteribacter salitolerans]